MRDVIRSPVEHHLSPANITHLTYTSLTFLKIIVKYSLGCYQRKLIWRTIIDSLSPKITFT